MTRVILRTRNRKGREKIWVLRFTSRWMNVRTIQNKDKSVGDSYFENKIRENHL